MIDRDYLVFLVNAKEWRTAAVVRLKHPPHEPPRGQVLRDILMHDLSARPDGSLSITGIMELPNVVWVPVGMSYEIGVGDGRVGLLERHSEGWRVHI